MAIDIKNVYAQLKAKCDIRFDSINTGQPKGDAGGEKFQTIDHYREANTTIGNKVIQISGASANAYNTVKVEYVGNQATKGELTPPGFIYSDGFAGCVFYLYKGEAGRVWGVHASRESGNLADPSAWFQQRGYTELWKWDSKGTLPDGKRLAGFNGAVLACVNPDEIVAFSLAVKGQVGGLKVQDISNVGTIKPW